MTDKPKLRLGEDWSRDLETGEGNGGPKYADLGLYYGDECILSLGLDHYEIRLDDEPRKIYARLKKVINEINRRLEST